MSRRLIVHGADAAPDRFPYFVTLDRVCGGALIAPDIVLTAGHCKPKHLDSVGEVHVGTYYFEADNENDTQVEEDDKETFALADMVRHPHFQRKGDDEFRHDFTILKLKGRSMLPVVRINRHDQVPAPQQELTAVGLGDLYNEWADDDDDHDDSQQERGPLRPTVLQQVTLNYLPNEECRLASNEEESYSDPPNRIGSTHLCTFTPPHNDKDACAYDSGGPIVIPGNDFNDDTLVALVSWGIGCADPVFPGVNARVSSVSAWIDEQVCRLSDDPPSDFGCSTSVVPPSLPPPSTTTLKQVSRGFFAVALVAVAAFLVVCFVRRTKRRVTYRQGGDDEDDSYFDAMFSPLKRMETGETASLYNDSESDRDMASYDSIPPQDA